MSLRSIGLQLLQTAPSRILAGVTKASASFWVRVNPGNNVVATNGVEVFGDAGGKFSATLSGTGSLRLLWSSNDGTANGTSACSLALTPGMSYHVAASWQPGSQQFYLNGTQVAGDLKVGSLGVLGDTTPRPFRLGSDQSGADVTLDQPTLWVGYALTPQDVINLRDRSAQPGAIAPSSIALAWSLAGTAGVAAKVGDAGLADSSANGLALSSIVGAAPAYQAGNLGYVATPTIGRVVAAPSGQSIVLQLQDGTGVASNIRSIVSSSEIQSITFQGLPAGSTFTLGYNGHATSPIPVTIGLPAAYALWTVPAVAGHRYSLAVEHQYVPASSILYEIMQGGKVVASTPAAGGQGDSSGIFYDPGVVNPSGGLTAWRPEFSAFSPSGASLQLRITASSDGGFPVGGLRVQDVTAGTISYYSADQSAYVSYRNMGLSPSSNDFNGYYLYGNGTGAGAIATAQGGAAAIQSALQALPDIGPQGLTVEDLSGQGSGNYRVHFAGKLGNAGLPLLTCSEPAIAIAEVARGGNNPTLSINGGPPVAIADWLWVTAGDSPNALGILPQSAPPSQTFSIGQLPYREAGPAYSWGRRGVAGSLSNNPIFGAVAGASAVYDFVKLPPGTYRVAVTYQPDPFSITFFGNTTRYSPAKATQFLVNDASGRTLATVAVDQSAAPADYSDASGRGWKVLGSFATDAGQDGLSLVMTTAGLPGTGDPLSVAVLDGVQLVRTSPDASAVIGPRDSATVSFPAGWMTTASGPLPATTSVPVSPPSPTSILPPFIPDRKSMKVGYNVVPVAPFSNFVSHSNLATLFGGLGRERDANGYPTKIDGNVMVSGSVLEYDRHEDLDDPLVGTYVINTGLWVLTWDGSTADVSLQPDSSTTMTPVSTTITGAAGNRIVYDVQVDPLNAASPTFRLRIGSNVTDPSDPSGNTHLVDVKNLKLYPPDPSDPTGRTIWVNPPKFHPWFLYKLQGVQSIRHLDTLATNSNVVHSFDHYKPASHMDRGVPFLAVDAPIASVRPPADPSKVSPGFTALCVQVTTKAPHGLYDGCIAQTRGLGDIRLADGSTLNLDGNTGSLPALCQVLDATNVLLYCQLNDSFPAMTGTVTPANATLSATIGTPWPLQDLVDLHAAVGCTDLWFNVHVTADASPGGCVDQVASFLAAHLPAGSKVHVEFGNECWNSPFPTSYWTAIKNGFSTGTYLRYRYQDYYASQAKAVHDRFLAVFAAAGRPGDVACVYGGQGGSVDGASLIARTVTAAGGRFDEYCTAYYFNNEDATRGAEDSQRPIYDRMSADQCMDFMEYNSAFGRQDVVERQVVAALAAAGQPRTKLSGYEGSPDAMVPGGLASANYTVRQNAVKRNPRMYGVMLHQAQVYQDAGLTIWNYYDLGGGSNHSAWDAWESGNPQVGTGDPALDPINATNPRAKNQVKSEVGGAWRYWAGLVKPTIVKKSTIPWRNGRIRATGLSRGLTRLGR